VRSFRVRNVNDAYHTIMRELIDGGLREKSRNGPVTVYPEPVCTTYEQPCERVLFSRARRANPFFHLFESFWMLAGRDDAAFLDRYVGDFGSRFSDYGGRLHGAYGSRWREWAYMDPEDSDPVVLFFDQIEWAVDLLLRDPTSRRAVIQMYDPSLDSTTAGVVAPKDIPCNTTIYLRMRPGGDLGELVNGTYRDNSGEPHDIIVDGYSLDLTVCCRSNDAIWGAFGANAVHFSVLLEYLAWRLDCQVGRLHQLSNNLHVYENTKHLWDPNEAFADQYGSLADILENRGIAPRSLFSGSEPVAFADELVRWLNDPSALSVIGESYSCPVFRELLIPMSRVHDLIRAKQWGTAEHILSMTPDEFDTSGGKVGGVAHDDWRLGALQWVQTRKRKDQSQEAAE
jgi:thymidylate synthase